MAIAEILTVFGIIYIALSYTVDLFFLFIGLLAINSQRKLRRIKFEDNKYPSLNILIPCFNEEQIILTTIKFLREINYPKLKFTLIYSGLYTVNGAVVEFDDGDPGNTWHYRGNFTSLTAMNGTMYNASWTQIGTWTAIKNSVARRANSKYKARSLQGFKNNNRKPSKKKR